MQDLLSRYQAVADATTLHWNARYRKLRLLGAGGQGAVYLSERQGTDRFTLPVALKIFSPEPYRDAEAYEEDMGRVAQVAARVALIQHDNLLDIHDFIAQDGIRVMEMEWLDGYDLRRLLTPEMLERTRERVSPERWEYVNNVILTAGPAQPRLKPGVAIQVLRECLAALAALHREGIVHGDLKPSNIMLKRTGNAKLIDIGSARGPEPPHRPPRLVAGLRRPRSAGGRGKYAALRPGQPGLRPGRDAGRPAAVRGADDATANCSTPRPTWTSGCRSCCRRR